MAIIASCSSKSRPHKLLWHKEKGYEWARLPSRQNGHVGFKELGPRQTGIHFINHLSKEKIIKNRLMMNGSGVAAGDINGDGLPDLYFCQLNGTNKFYKNLGGYRFKDITTSALALKNYHCTGAVFADVNGDGHLDLLVSTYWHGTILFLNDGKGRFTRDRNSGLDSTSVGGTTMTLADINSNGYLDLYVAHNRGKTIRDSYTHAELSANKIVRRVGDSLKVIPPFNKHIKIIKGRNTPLLSEFGLKDVLYINRKSVDGKWLGFRKVKDLKDHFLSSTGKKTGLFPDWGLSARFEDINNDGLPDLYVCNDYSTPDRVWINQGHDVFKAINPLDIRHYSLSAMNIAIGDINDDGQQDLFVTDMLSPSHERRFREFKDITPFSSHVGEIKNQPQYTRNMLYLNRGDNSFEEIANYSGVGASDWSWASTFLDVNLDGYEDIIINNGYPYDVRDLDTKRALSRVQSQHPFDLQKEPHGFLTYPPLKTVDEIYRNNGNLTFTNVSEKWGFHDKDVAQGLAVADLNNNGYLDLITNRLNAPAVIYENRINAPRIAVRLIGNPPNTQAIGAKITLKGGTVFQDRIVVSGGNYLSGSSPELMFATNPDSTDQILTIYWRDGKKSVIDSVRANRIYRITESQIPGQPYGQVTHKVTPKPSFKDISKRLNFVDHEDTFNDFKIQPLLPIKLSQLGPGLAWLNFGNGHPDLLETSGKGGKLAILANQGHGHFRRKSLPGMKIDNVGDQTAVVGWQTSQGTNIVVGSSNYEENRGNPKVASTYHYLIRHSRIIRHDSIPGITSSTGPLAAVDYNRDGTVDLFVGGRFIPGAYPKAATSRLYKNIDGHFVLDKVNSKLFKHIGMVTGAVFSDYNRDGWPDLLLSTSWGSLKLFENDHGVFHDVSRQVGLDKYKGWWNGVATGDFNNDGYPDIVATNWGQNSSYRLVPGHPLRMYYTHANGKMAIITANYDMSMKAYVPIRELYTYGSVPIMLHRLKSFRQYSKSTLKQIIGSALSIIPYKEINTLQNMVFISNGGKHFAAHPLPVQAQLAPAFYAGVADYNNDGNEDIFLSQNFFDLPAGQARLDAGRGLWFKGNGKGQFKAVPGQASGIKIYGEQRGAALGDFNNDGRVDLAVSQNGGQTKLFENQTPKEGLLIRLVGPGGNLDAIGSGIRIVYKGGSKGPFREIQAGSGYWSQNSAIQVMGTAGNVKSIDIRWPDGSRQTVPAKPGQMDYVITYHGN